MTPQIGPGELTMANCVEADMAAQFEFGGRDVPSLLQLHADRHPDAPFMIWEPADGDDRLWSYGAFWEAVQGVGAGLRARGVDVGDRVLIHSDNCPDMVIAWYGCALAGAIAVTTGTPSTADDMSYFVGQSTPRCAIVQAPYLESIAHLRDRFEWIAVIGGSREGGEGPGLDRFEDIAIPGETGLLRAPDPFLPIGIVYTSGSTNRPKAVLHTHANYLWAARVLPQMFDFRSDDVHLAQMPFYHVNAQIWTVVVALGAGGSFVLLPRFTGSRYWRILAKHGVTHSAIMPIIMQTAGDPPPPETLKLKVLTGSGDAAAAYGRRVGARLMGCYGMSELVVPVLSTSFADEWSSDSLGRATPGYGIRLFDPERGEICKPGETGEIQVRARRGIDIFAGYYANPEADRASFVDDGWFRTGDFARLGDAGELFFHDRGANRLKVGGENVSTGEVEQAIAEVAGVAEVAVVGRPDAALSEVVVAFVVGRADAPDNVALEQAILAHCTQRLSRFKRPRDIIFLDALPKLAIAGKIDKVRLKAQAAGTAG